MIITNNAYYLHIPKTAGTWVRTVLEPITLSHVDRAIPPIGFKHDHVYTFVRNPWAWYVSVYNFLNHGSELMNKPSALFRLLDKPKTFNDFVQSLCYPTPQFKNKLNQFYRLTFKEQLQNTGNLIDLDQQLKTDPHGIIYNTWVNNDVSFYEQLASVYMKYCTKIGKYETVQQDLVDMLTDSNELTDNIKNSIDKLGKINVTSKQVDYRTFYDTKTIEAVEQTSKFLKEFNYTYE